jgi:hypothetical protein
MPFKDPQKNRDYMRAYMKNYRKKHGPEIYAKDRANEKKRFAEKEAKYRQLQKRQACLGSRLVVVRSTCRAVHEC